MGDTKAVWRSGLRCSFQAKKLGLSNQNNEELTVHKNSIREMAAYSKSDEYTSDQLQDFVRSSQRKIGGNRRSVPKSDLYNLLSQVGAWFQY